MDKHSLRMLWRKNPKINKRQWQNCIKSVSVSFSFISSSPSFPCFFFWFALFLDIHWVIYLFIFTELWKKRYWKCKWKFTSGITSKIGSNLQMLAQSLYTINEWPKQKTIERKQRLRYQFSNKKYGRKI